MDAMLIHIRTHENRLRDSKQSQIRHFFTACKLFVLYLLFALHRGVVLLFAHPSKSFMLVHAQAENGVWNASYDEHVRFQSRVRFFSASSLCVLLTSIAIVWSVLNVVFPQGNTPFAYAAVNTFYVTNGNDSGIGSLRQALIDANGSAMNDTNNIQFDVVGQPTITLGSMLPAIARHVEFVNPNAAIAVVIDGTNIASPNTCVTLTNGSSNSIIKGIAVKNCPSAINVNGTVSNILIGNDGDMLADRVQIWNGQNGVAFETNVTNSTIKNVVIGQNPDGAARPLSGVGIRIAGSNNTVTRSQVGKCQDGIRIQGDNNTIKRSYVGIANVPVQDVNMGNTSFGIFIDGDGNIVGGTDAADKNVISYNNSGVTIQNNSASNNKIYINYIGLTIAGTAAAGNTVDGVFITNVGNNFIGDSVTQTGPVISGNGSVGIAVNNANVFVSNTIIGLSADQTQALGNGSFGANVSSMVPSQLEISQSVIGANGNAGVFYGANTSGRLVGNYIGTNAAQSQAFPNTNGGVSILGSDVIVGESLKGNVIANNAGPGITVNTANVGALTITDNTISSNSVEGIKVMSVNTGTVTMTNNTLSLNGAAADITVENSSNVTVTGSTITSDDAHNTHGIRFMNATAATASNNTVTSHKLGGISIAGTTSVEIAENTLQSNRAGVNVDESAGGSWNIHDNTITDNLAEGIMVKPPVAGTTVAITNNTLSNNTGSGTGRGMLLQGVDGATVQDNTVENNELDGIAVTEITDTTFDGNTISDNGANGISIASNSNGNTVIGNTIAGSGAAGVLLQSADNNVVGNTTGGGNVIHSGAAAGVGMDSETNSNQIVGNSIGTDSVGTPLGNYRGIRDDGNDNVVDQNVLANNTSFGLTIAGARGVYTNNSITSNTLSGIRVEATARDSMITGNFIGLTFGLTEAGNSENGILVEDGAEGISIGGDDGGNSIANNTLAGVTVQGASTIGVLVSQNSIYENGGLPIDLQDGANNNIQNPTISVASDNAIVGSGGYADGTVELYANGIYIGRDTTLGADGQWLLSAADYLQPADDLMGQTITAINIDSDNNTSEFSDGVVMESQDISIETSATATETTATIDVTTDPETTAKVFYGTDNDDLSSSESDDTPSTTHTFDLAGLTPGTQYFYRVDVEAQDESTASSDVESFVTDGGEAGDITVATRVTTAETVATIQITTDPATTVAVNYGTSRGDLSESVSDTTLSTTHTLALSDLTVGTTYYYQVVVTAADDTTGTTDVASFTTTDLDFAYVQSNTSVSGQHVYNPATNLFVAPGGVKLKVAPADNSHDVKLTVRDTNKNIVLQGDWLQVNNQKFVQVLQDLQKNEEYTVQAQARITTKPSAQSEKKKIATFTITRDAPTITSLNGDYTVTTNSLALDFSGLAQNSLDSQFRFQNAATGDIVATCGNPCTLPFALPAGVYNVLYESLKNGLASAPALHTLVLTHAKATPVLNTDPRNDGYIDRIVTSSSVTVVGLGPKGATATVYLNGTSVGTATYTTDIGWQFHLNLSGVQQNSTNLLEVKYTKENGSQTGVNVYYPFMYVSPVTTPVVSELAAEYEQGANFTFTVTGGNGDRINVFRGSTFVYAADLVNGAAEVPVLTDAIGSQTLSIQAENTIGLKSTTALVSYAVVSQITNTNDNGGTSNENTNTGNENENTNTGNQGTNGNTNSGNQNGNTNTNTNGTVNGNTNSGTSNGNVNGNTNTNANGNANTNTGANSNTNTNGGSTNGGTRTEDEIPLVYRTPVTDPVEVAQLKTIIDRANTKSALLTAEERTVDPATGEVLETKTLGKNAEDKQVIRRITYTGITIEVPVFERVVEFFTKATSDVLVVSGETEPYATVTVTIYSDPIVQVTRADSDGKWTMTVPADALPAGEHTAYVETESRGVASDQVEIAKFVVVEEKTISNTTWIFIVNMVIAIILLIVAITLQIRGKHNKLQPATAGPAVTVQKAASQAKKNDNDKDDDDTPSYHSALGV